MGLTNNTRYDIIIEIRKENLDKMNQALRFFDEHDFIIVDAHDEHIDLFSCNQIKKSKHSGLF